MKRTKIKDRVLPDYTRGEEIFNMVSHIVGGAFGIAALATCVVKAFLNGDPYQIVSAFIYGFSMVLLYTVSSVYGIYTYSRYIYPRFPVLAENAQHSLRLDGIRNRMGCFRARNNA